MAKKATTLKNKYEWKEVKRSFKKSEVKSVINVLVQPKDLFLAVNKFGGFNSVMKKRCWNYVRLELKVPPSTSIGNVLKNVYMHYFPKLFGKTS